MLNIIFTNDQMPIILGVSFLVVGSYLLITHIRRLEGNATFIGILKVLLSVVLVVSSIQLAAIGVSFIEIL